MSSIKKYKKLKSNLKRLERRLECVSSPCPAVASERQLQSIASTQKLLNDTISELESVKSKLHIKILLKLGILK